jgi:hypothetical protein
MNLDPLLSPAMDTGLPLALVALSSRLLGVVAIVFGVTVVRWVVAGGAAVLAGRWG